jgi:threonine dehydratase
MPLIANPHRAELVADGHGPRAIEFHRRLPDYARTPLRALPDITGALGLGDVLVKDDSRRLGLPSLRMLGASWAAYRARRATRSGSGAVEDGGRTTGPPQPPLAFTLSTATDGNQGRAVARVARHSASKPAAGCPANTAAARIAAIESEGAVVEITDGGYNDAVREAARAAHFASGRTVLVSDMAGLNCASPSLLAWPLVSAGLDFLATVDDDQARPAMRDLAAHGVVAGESGAASLAGLGEALADLPEAGAVHGTTTVLLISTEGATDPQAYATVVGCSADKVVTAA